MLTTEVDRGPTRSEVFEHIAARWRPAILTVCRAVLADYPNTWLELGDLIQETHIRLYRRLGYVVRARKPTSYIWQVARSAAVRAVCTVDRPVAANWSIEDLENCEDLGSAA